MRWDTSDRNSMMFRLYRLWDDPVNSARSFATLLRFHSHHGVDEFPVLAGKYELLEALGQGGNGQVFLAWSRETQSTYALKTIRLDHLEDVGARQRFREEVHAWVRISDHPNVAKLYFLDLVNSDLLITMELVEGDDNSGPALSDKLKNVRISDQDMVSWFCGVADGLAQAYADGVSAHRDVKCSNILIDSRGVAKISDFGLAVSGELGEFAGLGGTPSYMAPEQFDGRACDQRTDVYAIGICMYEVASSGQLPFTSNRSWSAEEYLREMYLQHFSARPARLRSIFWPVIERCLQKEPSQRYSSVGHFRAELSKVAVAAGLQIRPVAIATNDFWSYRDKGNTLMRLGRYEEALTWFDRFLKRLPDDSARTNKACCLENLGRYAEALSIYEDLARSAESVAAFNNGATCLMNLGDMSRARAFIKEALKRSPSDATVWITAGNFQFKSQRWREALDAYGTASRLAPQDATPAYNYSLAALRLGEHQLAANALKTFVAIAAPEDSRLAWANAQLGKLSAAG